MQSDVKTEFLNIINISAKKLVSCLVKYKICFYNRTFNYFCVYLRTISYLSGLIELLSIPVRTLLFDGQIN